MTGRTKRPEVVRARETLHTPPPPPTAQCPVRHRHHRRTQLLGRQCPRRARMRVCQLMRSYAILSVFPFVINPHECDTCYTKNGMSKVPTRCRLRSAVARHDLGLGFLDVTTVLLSTAESGWSCAVHRFHVCLVVALLFLGCNLAQAAVLPGSSPIRLVPGYVCHIRLQEDLPPTT